MAYNLATKVRPGSGSELVRENSKSEPSVEEPVFKDQTQHRLSDSAGENNDNSASAGWDDVVEGDRDPSEYEVPPAPSRTISAPRRADSTVQVPDKDKINKKRKRGESLGPSASDASEATDATCGHVRGAERE